MTAVGGLTLAGTGDRLARSDRQGCMREKWRE